MKNSLLIKLIILYSSQRILFAGLLFGLLIKHQLLQRCPNWTNNTDFEDAFISSPNEVHLLIKCVQKSLSLLSDNSSKDFSLTSEHPTEPDSTDSFDNTINLKW